MSTEQKAMIESHMSIPFEINTSPRVARPARLLASERPRSSSSSPVLLTVQQEFRRLRLLTGLLRWSRV